jgi:flavin reductase (DIM6/NTAB) family NADH-FMN oxidoreductase RutF
MKEGRAVKMKKIDPESMTPEVFKIFDTNNALLTAGDREKCNTMTIGWCGLGRLWNLPTCTVYVRPERYTYEFTEKCDYFTVSVLPLSQRKQMTLCGTKSGREVDKFAECGYEVQYGMGDAPFPDCAEWVLVCRKLYAQDMTPSCVLDDRVNTFYRTDGWHRMYVGEVVEAYIKSDK